MVFCTIFTALDLIRVVISFRISVTTRLLAWRLSRFRICFPLGFLDTHSRSKMPSKKFGARPPARPKNFFSTSRFSIADWKGGMGHGFEKFIPNYPLDRPRRGNSSLGYFPARPAALGEANRRRSLLQVLLRSHPGRKPSFYLPFVGLAFGFLFPGSGIFTCANPATASLKLRG